jgi:hypothetical protein
MREGARKFANLTTVDEEQMRAMMKLEHDLREKIDEARRLLEMQLAALQDTVNPRMTIWKVGGWIAVLIVPTAIALAGWVWTASRYPDRTEFRELADKVSRVFIDVEVIKKGGHP